MIARAFATNVFIAALSASAATVGETDRFIPLVQDGGGWTTEITLLNVTRKPATISVTFLNEKGNNDSWKLNLKASAGKIYDNGAEIPIAPGGLATIATAGEGGGMKRGFADIVDFQEQAVAGFATLVHREGGAVVERIQVPLSPANESRSAVAVDLANGEAALMSWVTLTTSTTLDLVFRDAAGSVFLTETVRLDDTAHKVVDLLETWPQLAGFKGTLEWTVTFPNADRYEHRTLAGVALHRSPESGRLAGASSGVTLPENQRNTSPY